MTELLTTTQLVQTVLLHEKQARNSDSFLYLKVLEHIAEEKGIDLQNLTVPDFLSSLNILPFPGFETVRRSRQRLQALNPLLAASDEVESFRADKEKEYRAFALGDPHVKC